jgi:hypothetical protein
MRRLIVPMMMTAAALCAQDPQEIIRRSVAANNADWKMIPQFAHHETDISAKLNGNGSTRSTTTKTVDVLMIDGSEYNRLLAVNGKPLSPEEQKAEEEKLRAEINKREHESPAERARRVGKYQRERQRDHLLMTELTKAFDFKLNGQETVGGRQCYVLDATPRAGYQPPNGEAKVLTGMRGRLWIDTQGYHWVKVEAEVVKPVSTYMIANVRPGTKFEFEQQPLNGVWLPHRFSQSVNARVLGVHSILSREDETYTNYRRVNAQAMLLPHQ